MATGKAAGFQFFDHARAKTLIERGFTLAAVAGDLNTITVGSAAILADFGR
jgi:2-keto-3-deoxy-L-rhamnonate aldolase RhmA